MAHHPGLNIAFAKTGTAVGRVVGHPYLPLGLALDCTEDGLSVAADGTGVLFVGLPNQQTLPLRTVGPGSSRFVRYIYRDETGRLWGDSSLASHFEGGLYPRSQRECTVVLLILRDGFTG